MQTANGHVFWPLDPKPEEVFIEDIGHALGNICRFNGHSNIFYSVAQHSVLASYYVEAKGKSTKAVPAEIDPRLRQLALAALLHDATEAYACDIIRPVKRLLVGYKEIESGIAAAITEAFASKLGDVSLVELPPEVEEADQRMLATEMRDLMITSEERSWNLNAQPYADRIYCWTPSESRRRFLKRFRELTSAAVSRDMAPMR